MIRQMAQCPYCKHCELALDDNLQLAFNPDDADRSPCPHLAFVDGRYEQRERDGRGIERVIGSTEFRWLSNSSDAEDRIGPIEPYLRELLESSPGWEFAPPIAFSVQSLSADGKARDAKGASYTAWEVDGHCIFAEVSAAFWSALPDCHERHLASLKIDEP
jgi:hypothetical protein